MPDPDTLLLRALRAAPRRHAMPPLPAGVEAAAAAGTEVALAFAIEAARLGKENGTAAPPEVRDLFTSALADLVRTALTPNGGDPAFQALLLRGSDAQVREHVQLAAQAASDQREVRSTVDAIAHPGKLRALAPGPLRTALERLHALAAAQAWSALRDAVSAWPQGDSLHATLSRLRSGDALARLVRADELLQSAAVQHYLALCRRQGPLAGSDAAAARGRASARLGEQAEAATVQAFEGIARLLDDGAGGAPHRVVQGLRIPRGFPGTTGQGKEEWDVALLRGAPPAELVLLAEVKAAPAAATPDFPRLLRGLHRLAHADPAGSHVFPTASGEVCILGASLQRLRPAGQALPPHAIYCCTAPAETTPAFLSAASKAVLLAEPASLQFARRISAGHAAVHAELAPAWQALTTAARLRSALHQYQAAQTVRAAMLQPHDLLAELARQLAS
jgi:hypothetical protein